MYVSYRVERELTGGSAGEYELREHIDQLNEALEEDKRRIAILVASDPLKIVQSEGEDGYIPSIDFTIDKKVTTLTDSLFETMRDIVFYTGLLDAIHYGNAGVEFDKEFANERVPLRFETPEQKEEREEYEKNPGGCVLRPEGSAPLYINIDEFRADSIDIERYAAGDEIVTFFNSGEDLLIHVFKFADKDEHVQVIAYYPCMRNNEKGEMKYRPVVSVHPNLKDAINTLRILMPGTKEESETNVTVGGDDEQKE